MGKFISRSSAGLLLAIAATTLTGCDSCGFDCNDDNASTDPVSFTLGFSDSQPEDLNKVVIQVETITLVRNDAEDVVIDTFTIKELDLVDAATFEIDLLDYRGVNRLLVIKDETMEADFYDSVVIAINSDSEDDTLSYVEEADGPTIRAISVDAGQITLPGLQLLSGDQDYTVEFGLARALQFQSSTGTYLLTTEGVTMEHTDSAAKLNGTVADTLFDTESPCDEKIEPLAGNRVYLYEGHNLELDDLSDVHSTSDSDAPDTALAPFAVATLVEDSLTGEWRYAFGYLPADDYTIAFACDTSEDDAVSHDGLIVPQPSDQFYEVTLSESQTTVCDITEDPSAGC
jgi:hypothetical protein